MNKLGKAKVVLGTESRMVHLPLVDGLPSNTRGSPGFSVRTSCDECLYGKRLPWSHDVQAVSFCLILRGHAGRLDPYPILKSTL